MNTIGGSVWTSCRKYMNQSRNTKNNFYFLLLCIGVFLSFVKVSTFPVDLPFVGRVNLTYFRVYLPILLVFTIIDFRYIFNKITSQIFKSRNFSLLFFGVWFSYALISVFWVSSKSDWVQYMLFFSSGIMFVFLFSVYVETKGHFRILLNILIFLLVFHNLIAWYELTTENYLFLATNRITIYAQAGYPVSMFGNTNDFATYLFFSILFALISLVLSRAVVARFFIFCLIVSSLILLIETQSRAALLGLLLTFFVLIYLSFSSKRNRMLYLIISAVFLVCFLTTFSSINFIDMFNTLISNNGINYSSSESIRVNLIKNGLAFLFMTCGFGVGAGNIEYWIKNFGQYDTGGTLNMHNMWIDVLTSFGVFIFVYFCVFYIKLVRNYMRVADTTKEGLQSLISKIIVGLLIGFTITSVSSSSVFTREWVWIFLGIIISLESNITRFSRNQINETT